MMPLGMSGQLVGLLSTTMIYCSLGTSHRMAYGTEIDAGGREEETVIKLHLLSHSNVAHNKPAAAG